MRWRPFLARLLVAAPIAACSSEGNIVPKKERFTPTNLPDASQAMDAEPDVEPDIADDGKKPRDPNANCVKPGTPNNERGVGGYCEPGRGDCESDAGSRFCTADFADLTPIADDRWFCSTVCTMNEDCGTGMVCAASGIGSGCAPLVCRMDAGTSSRASTAPDGIALSR